MTGAIRRQYAHLVHDSRLDLAGSSLERDAVRGVLWRGPLLLMIRSNDGDVGFPGGGVQSGETPQEALRREMWEEAGLSDVIVGDEIATIVEHRSAREPHIDVFTMVSRYYLCESSIEPGEQRLDAYEADLGLTPVWMDPVAALRRNEAICRGHDVMHWVVRETLALRLLGGSASLAG